MSIYESLDDRTLSIITKYDSMAEKYAVKTANSSSPSDIDKFIELLPDVSEIIDVGCSAGRDCKIFMSRNIKVKGVDLSSNLLEIAKNNNPQIKFYQADARNLPFDDEQFDGVWAHGLLHEIERDKMEIVISELKRILKKNGIVYIRTKMGEGSTTVKDIMSSGEEREVTYLSVDELENLFEQVNMEKIDFIISKSKSRELYWISAFYRK